MKTKVRPATYLKMGMSPSAYGSNANLDLRNAVRTKLASMGVPTKSDIGVKTLCKVVAGVMGAPMPEPGEAHGLLSRFYADGRPPAPPQVMSWDRSPMTLDRQMRHAMERCRELTAAPSFPRGRGNG